MNKLIVENLKLFRSYYLYNMLSIFIGLFCLNYFNLSGFPYINNFLLIIIFIPETYRLKEISNSGYFQYLNKLPISRDAIYKHKFITGTSSIFFILLLIAISGFFLGIPAKLIEGIRLLSSLLLALIIVNLTTNLNNSLLKFSDQVSKFEFFIIFCILYAYYLLLFELMTSKFCMIFGHNLISINYVAFLIMQFTTSYYLSLLFYRKISKTSFYKKHQYSEDLKIQI